jgi:hypothetical protein
MPSIREQLKSYETGLGKRMGRLAITIDQGQVSQLGFTAKGMQIYLKGLCIFLVISSIIILATGSYADSSNDSIQALGSGFINIVYMCGAFLLIMGVTGLCGSVRESRLLLFVFAFLVGCMTIILIILAAVALSYVGQEASLLNRFWQGASDGERAAIQNNWFCCGANTNPCINYYPDWNVGKKEQGYYPGRTECSSLIMGQSSGQDITNAEAQYEYQLPSLPCPPPSGNTPPGCTGLLVNSLKSAATGFGVAGIFLGVFCLSGMLATCCLLSGIRASEDQANAVNKKSKAAPGKSSKYEQV